jgi:integrase
MDIMGWTEARMLSRYQHVVDELRHDAARRMGAALWGDNPTHGGLSSGPGSGEN